ncbi:hypothetical protein H6770_05680 [Candidatus Peribacteria bacterium]|nr:hypothetical protein [Candidatus Peribacteria bacterium]
MEIELPNQGFVFWPVGTGDSTTICVDADTFIQVDLHHMECADEENDTHEAVVDRLVELLPVVNGRPYLSVFVLTHPDLDHCQGFERLLQEVTIGELWFTPRIFWEYKKDLCDDALAFRAEAERRINAVIAYGGSASSGDRVRMVGYEESVQEAYRGFPSHLLTVPGGEISELDGKEYAGIFRAFIHAPFKDDVARDRNDTSLAMQVALGNATTSGTALLLGDHCYPTLRKIFDSTIDKSNLAWNVLLAPHHCSKSAMYWQGENQLAESLKQDILDSFTEVQQTTGYVVASCEPIPASNQPGDNPPHVIAKRRYEQIANSGFLCTQEYGSDIPRKPIIFALTEGGLLCQTVSDAFNEGNNLAMAVGALRGNYEPPAEHVGFGACH